VVREYLKLTPLEKTIVFNCNIAHAEEMTRQFNQVGVPSKCITSNTPTAEREEILKGFSLGLFPVLNNCGVLTTGYDEPSIKVVIINRATMSLPLFLQMIGRGSRTFPDKTQFTVLDFGMNHDRHGLWIADRTWSIEKPKKKKVQPAPVKSCPQCSAMLFASATVCEYCGYQFPKKSSDELSEGVMIELQEREDSIRHLKGKSISQLSVDDFIALEKAKKYKPAFVWRILRTMGHDKLSLYAEKKGYSKYWADRQMKQPKGVKMTLTV
jgi:superfamily II DNA or RNA helicase